MQMAIDKAKKHGVGFVACKNSTVSLHFQLSHCRSVGSIMFDFSSFSIMELLDIMPLWRQSKDGKFHLSFISSAHLDLPVD